MTIDAHHHLWKYSSADYDWIDDDMSVLKQDYLLPELHKVMSDNDIQGSIVVQARQSLIETDWLLDLADASKLIKGVVGWVDLKSPDLASLLEHYQKQNKLVGFRHVIQAETDPDFMLNPKFLNGLKLLAEHKLTFDLLIFSHQLPQAIKMLEQVPDLRVVIDHIAKPEIKEAKNKQAWRDGMEALARNPNTYCKVSGMVTEADWESWKAADFEYYLEQCLLIFGERRLMFGSDWPVCLVAAEYSQIKSLVDNFFAKLDAKSRADIFDKNAKRFYQLT